MELTFTGIEIHALRETLEGVLADPVEKRVGAEDPAMRETIEARRKVLRAILDRLPAELTSVA